MCHCNNLQWFGYYQQNVYVNVVFFLLYKQTSTRVSDKKNIISGAAMQNSTVEICQTTEVDGDLFWNIKKDNLKTTQNGSIQLVGCNPRLSKAQASKIEIWETWMTPDQLHRAILCLFLLLFSFHLKQVPIYFCIAECCNVLWSSSNVFFLFFLDYETSSDFHQHGGESIMTDFPFLC